jgi:hypothetical protein
MMTNEATSIEVRPITIKKVHLWRKEIDARPTALAAALQPFADAGIRLRVFMRYRHFRDEQRAVVEVCPHESEDQDRCASVMRAAGLKISNILTLLIEGEETLGVDYAIAKIVAEQDLNLVFCVSQTASGKQNTLIGFVSEADAEKAALALVRLNMEGPSMAQ